VSALENLPAMVWKRVLFAISVPFVSFYSTYRNGCAKG
jgi:hypothetical protein